MVNAAKSPSGEVSSGTNGNSGSDSSKSDLDQVVSIKTLLDAGAHFGHQSHRWNPRMMPYIYGERNGIHIINLDLTLKLWERARKFLFDTLSRGGNVLFVGTKQQARDIVKSEAQRCGGYSVTTRWLGGTLSNFQTIKNSIDRMRKLEDMLVKAENPESGIRLSKKEKLNISRDLGKLDNNLGGIRAMKRLPDVLFVVDTIKENIAVAEARKLNIPIIALVDTNTDPRNIDFPVPSNDDAARTIQLFCGAASNAVIEGRAEYEARRAKDDQKNQNRSNTVRAEPSEPSVEVLDSGSPSIA